ncbi:MAG: retropepsin-like domain-containing protein [Euryarchaeota archaeon]|nr:retropepsin-like domain-containing protein [Euryarchaeota archaeon]
MADIPLTFDERGQLTVTAFMGLPTLGKSGVVNFIVDTGSNYISLGYSTCERLCIDPLKCPTPRRGLGYGGAFLYRPIEKAAIIFTDSKDKYLPEFPIKQVNLLIDLPRPLGTKGKQAYKDEKLLGFVRQISSVLGRSFFEEHEASLHINWKEKTAFISI